MSPLQLSGGAIIVTAMVLAEVGPRLLRRKPGPVLGAEAEVEPAAELELG